jgi:hypothetical protein
MPSNKMQLPTAIQIAICTGVTLFAVFCVWAAAVLLLHPTVQTAQTPFSSTTTHAVWQSEVAQSVGTLNAQSSQNDIRSVEQHLLTLTVIGEDRESDLALILALVAFERGDTDGWAHVQAAVRTVQDARD